MVRAIDDRTSTCRSCSYWDSSAPGLPLGTGYCGYSSVPAWVHKHLLPRDDHRIMSADEGLDCWQHAQRVTNAPDGLTTEQRLHRLSVVKGQSGSQKAIPQRPNVFTHGLALSKADVDDICGTGGLYGGKALLACGCIDICTNQRDHMPPAQSEEAR